MRTWNISIYNAYNAMNPNIVYSKYKKSELQSYTNRMMSMEVYHRTYREEGENLSSRKLTILPCIPSVTYTYRF